LLEIQCHWSPQECAEVSTLFEKFILHDSLPPKTMIEKSIQQSGALAQSKLEDGP